MSRSKLFVFLLVSSSAFADVIFTDNTFSLGGYTTTTKFTAAGTTLSGSQCPSCGKPGDALQIESTFGSSGGNTAQGFINNSFSYDPSTQGAIFSINASVDKNLTLSLTSGGPFTNTFRPTIEQGGNFYVAAINGPGFPGGSTGFQTLSQSGLTAADFVQFDFSTDTFGSGNPNFSGGPMLFGLTQISGLGALTPGTGASITASYDNLSLDIVNTPEPSGLGMAAGLVGMLAAFGIFRRRRARLS